LGINIIEKNMANKKKIIALNKNDLLQIISTHANYISPDIVRDVYYGLVRVIGLELRDKGAIELPDLGYLVLHTHKARRALNVSNGLLEMLPEKSTIKFKPCHDLKKHFHLLGDKS